jgi:CubicO group peptidase (beta-lactamase class C family)
MARALTAGGVEALDKALARHVEHGDLPGLVALVARGDDVHVTAIGHKAFGDAEPIGRDAIFRIASVSKPISGAAAMLLIEDGAMALDDPVRRWLPELAEPRVLRRLESGLDDTVPAERPITVEDVLSFHLGFGQRRRRTRRGRVARPSGWVRLGRRLRHHLAYRPGSRPDRDPAHPADDGLAGAHPARAGLLGRRVRGHRRLKPQLRAGVAAGGEPRLRLS